MVVAVIVVATVAEEVEIVAVRVLAVAVAVEGAAVVIAIVETLTAKYYSGCEKCNDKDADDSDFSSSCNGSSISRKSREY